MSNYRILTSEERERIDERLLRYGITALERDPKVFLYLAELHREKQNDARAYGYLLRALSLGKGTEAIPEAIVRDYRAACEKVPKEALCEDYEGCLVLGKELITANQTERGIYYLSIAANSAEDRLGIAARLLADHLAFGSDPRVREQARKYDLLAAQKGMPDIIAALSHRVSRNRMVKDLV